MGEVGGAAEGFGQRPVVGWDPSDSEPFAFSAGSRRGRESGELPHAPKRPGCPLVPTSVVARPRIAIEGRVCAVILSAPSLRRVPGAAPGAPAAVVPPPGPGSRAGRGPPPGTPRQGPQGHGVVPAVPSYAVKARIREVHNLYFLFCPLTTLIFNQKTLNRQIFCSAFVNRRVFMVVGDCFCSIMGLLSPTLLPGHSCQFVFILLKDNT